MSKVRGRFASFSGEIVIAADPAESSVVTIEPSSITTGSIAKDYARRQAFR